MALEIVWTYSALRGFEKIVKYLETNWTERELRNFLQETNNFVNLIRKNPEILQKTTQRKNVFRGPLNRYSIITYRVNIQHNKLEILNIRGVRQKPLKRS